MSSGRTTIGINDIATTHPELVKYFANKEDATKYKAGSNKKCMFKCTICGNERMLAVYDLVSRNFSCPRCGDGISFPEKMMYGLLSESKIDFEYQKSFDWAVNNNKKFRYDFYFIYNGQKYIVETDGGQHFHKGFIKDVTKVQERDKIKQNLAEKHGIHVIRADCRNSEYDFILNNIKKTPLIGILDLTEDALYRSLSFSKNNNMTKFISDLWNEYKDIDIVVEKSKICLPTIKKYFVIANKIGLIDITYEDMIYNHKVDLIKKRCNIPIVCIETKQKFDSAVECAKYFRDKYGIQMDNALISRVCKGSNSMHKGFHFKYDN